MRLIGVLPESQEPSPEDAQICLDALNEMQEAAGLLRAAVFMIQQDLLPWPAFQVSRTIGIGGDISLPRPIQLEEGCFTRDSDGMDQDLWQIRERQEYDALPNKTEVKGRPRAIFYEPSYPLATIYLYPVPDVQITVVINHRQPLQQFDSLNTVLSMPPGYRKAIRFNLACTIHPEFPTANLPQSVIEMAADALANIQRLNQPRPTMENRMAMMYGRGGRFSIRTGFH